MRSIQRFTIRPALPEPLAGLEVLARNLRWTWDHPTQGLFRSLDEELWLATGRDPLRLLREVSPGRLEALAGDSGYTDRLHQVLADLERYLTEPRWYQRLHEAPGEIAYFSPEFGVSEVLAQYSGGLGILAGDHLKAASDLGAPLVGVGLFYRHGYFRQRLSASGLQLEQYPNLDPRSLPLELLCDPAGAPALVRVRFPTGPADAQIWIVRIGRVPLLLLDSDVPSNAPDERAVTERLYGGNSEYRLRQEILLGIGGMRALDAFGTRPEVFHTNEGHAGFLGLERIRRLLAADGLDLSVAVEVVRRGTLFTTHTPVEAGIDRFPRELVARYFGPDGEDLGIGVDALLELGREPGGDEQIFNMAVMGLRLAQRSNGVSRLHGSTSRRMFHRLWPDLLLSEVPIGSITNGVHAGTWLTREWAELFDRWLGPEVGEGDAARNWNAIHGVPDEELWASRQSGRAQLVHEVRHRLREAALGAGGDSAQLGWLNDAYDENVLTIGFARRVPAYKRLTLLLRQRERLLRLLLDPERPVQLFVAGKAHPADVAGKELIREFARFAADPAVRHRVAFLPDYGMALARRMVSGADVWLNNPLRPFEACGTSGMKAALNGALNLSIRDGWWDELYDGGNGWAIPSADDDGLDPEERDEMEAAGLLDLLERRVVPLFYDRPDGMPRSWIGMMKHSIATLGPAALATRMVREYTERMYLPAAEAAREATADDLAVARDLAAWKARVRAEWPEVRIRAVELPSGEQVVGDRVRVSADVALGQLTPDDVGVEALFGQVDDQDTVDRPDPTPLKAVEPVDGGWRFEGEATFGAGGSYGAGVRVVARLEGLAGPEEVGLATWAGGGGPAPAR